MFILFSVSIKLNLGQTNQNIRMVFHQYCFLLITLPNINGFSIFFLLKAYEKVQNCKECPISKNLAVNDSCSEPPQP